jgi:hypothetical protein
VPTGIAAAAPAIPSRFMKERRFIFSSFTVVISFIIACTFLGVTLFEDKSLTPPRFDNLRRNLGCSIFGFVPEFIFPLPGRDGALRCPAPRAAAQPACPWSLMHDLRIIETLYEL